MSSQTDTKPSGPVAAVFVASGIASLVLGLFVTLNEMSPDISTFLKFEANFGIGSGVGPLSGKVTLAVRLGPARTRMLYTVCALAPFALLAALAVSRPWVALAILALPLAIRSVRPVLGRAEGRDLVAVLQATGRLQLAFGALLAAGLALG